MPEIMAGLAGLELSLLNLLRNDERISSSFQVSNFLLRQGGETLA
jgi:hypothetical protein